MLTDIPLDLRILMASIQASWQLYASWPRSSVLQHISCVANALHRGHGKKQTNWNIDDCQQLKWLDCTSNCLLWIYVLAKSITSPTSPRMIVLLNLSYWMLCHLKWNRCFEIKWHDARMNSQVLLMVLQTSIY